HGWSYGQAGNCLRIPAHPGLTPPETIRVATHDVEETDNVIWVAVGTPASIAAMPANAVSERKGVRSSSLGGFEAG
ncbi:Rieske (2Fe-2S) protein, partial [Rhizobium ruizarguesonis]